MITHSFIKFCLMPLLSVVISTFFCAVTAQSPLYPFPQQAPAAVSAQPFLQPGQIVVGKASVTHFASTQNQAPAQRSYVSPTLVSSNTLNSNTVVANTALPTPIARSYAAPLQIVLSEHEMLNINPRTELAYQGRIERHVQSSRDINSFTGMMIQSLGRHGWSTSWQGIRNPSGTILTDLYQSGGQHLRLEVGQNSNTTGGYQIVLYNF